jgi:uncharacterized iron-regulated protein
MTRAHHLLRSLPALAAALAAASCAATPETPVAPAPVPAVPADFAAEALPAFDGESGAALDFAAVLERAAPAAVVIVGETHDDAVGHGYQRALVQALCQRYPGSALALEMLERDEQVLVADWLEGLLDAEGFARESGSTAWAGPDSWALWYQPILDAARDNGARIVAANAPRRYVRAARQLGFERLAALEGERRAWFDLPFGEQPLDYRERFLALMGGMGHGEPLSPEEAAKVFDSQSVWDATMAGSVHAAAPSVEHKVLLLVGQFHSDHAGGTVAQLRYLGPELEILTLSLVPEVSTTLRPEDQGRASIVVYTGR